MYVKNATINDLDQALKAVNKLFDDNVVWNRAPERIGKGIRFTLKVQDSRGKGAYIAPSGRRTSFACWHVHGEFFDVLFTVNPTAVITSAGNRIDKNEGNWSDKNIGSKYHSECCECE